MQTEPTDGVLADMVLAYANAAGDIARLGFDWARKKAGGFEKVVKECAKYFEECNIVEISPSGIISKKVIPCESHESDQDDAEDP